MPALFPNHLPTDQTDDDPAEWAIAEAKEIVEEIVEGECIKF